MENYPGEFDWDMLDQAVEMDFRGWQPEEGDKIMGTVVYLAEGESEWGTYPMVALITKEGDSAMIHAFHTTLRNALERQKPQPGDVIAVKYVGRIPSDKGNDAYLYNVIVKHMNAAPPMEIASSGPAPALPSGSGPDGGGAEPDGSDPAPVVEAPAAPAPASPIGQATKPQKAAIFRLLNQQGFEPHDFEAEPMTIDEAAQFIRELQS